MKYKFIFFLITALSIGACTENESAINDTPQEESVRVNLSIQSRSVYDPMSINQDQEFSSMAIYLFNNDANFTLDKSALQPSFTPSVTQEIPIETHAGTKILYLIANYANKTFKLPNGTSVTLTPSTPKSVLEQMTVESNSGFIPGSLLMVGKQTLSFSDSNNGSTVNIALRRLQSRIDMHVYKGANFGSNTVTLKSIALHNQVLNSEVTFDYSASSAQMPASPIFNSQQVTNSSELLPYSSSPQQTPRNAQAIFYSYQNLVTLFSPLQVTAPHLEIKLLSNGIEKTYKGYFTDSNRTTYPYSLLQNNVYQITAILDTDSKIELNVNVLPWNQQTMDYQRPITANDFTFGAWQTSWGGTNGKTMNTNAGGLEDAVFQFELKTPIGAAWAATLTNGLDFTFTPSTAGTSLVPVAKGFTNVGQPYLIAVRATKRWTGEARSSEFYITVEGQEIPINPIIGSQRKYEGTDTRIVIKQVASYN